MCLASSSRAPGPDEGWAWVVAFACFAINFIMAGLARTAGVLYVALIELYGVSRESATTPFSIRVCMRNMMGPIVGLLGQRYGIRPITTIGGIVAAVGGMLCYLAPDIFWITIFWGVIHGLGFGLSTVLHMMAINQYFDKYRATALGIGYSGDCFGTFAFPVILETLLSHFDVKGTFLILGGIVLNVIPVALLLKKPPWLRTNIRNQNEAKTLESGYKNEGFVQSKLSLNVPSDEKKDSNKCDSILEDIDDLPTELHLYNKPDGSQVGVKNRRNSILSSITDIISSFGSETGSHEMLPHCVPEGVISLRGSREVVNLAAHGKPTDSIPISDNNLNAESKDSRPRSVSNYEVSRAKHSLDTRQNSLPRRYCGDKEMRNNCLSLALENAHLKNSSANNKLSNHIIMNVKEIENPKESKDINTTIDTPQLVKPDIVVTSDSPSLMSMFLRTNVKPIFILISVSMGAYVFLFIGVLTVIIDYAADHGVAPNDAKFLVIGFSVADLIGRLSFGLVIDKKLLSMRVYAGMTISLMGIFVTAIPLHSGLNYMMTCMAFYGLIQGGTAIMFPILIGEYMDKNEESIAMGCLNFYGGLLMLPMAPMIGFFRDTIGSYNGMFYIVGGICIVVGLLWQFEPLIVNRQEKPKIISCC